MRPAAVSGSNRPASRARARSPAAPSKGNSQAAAYGFQSRASGSAPVQGGGPGPRALDPGSFPGAGGPPARPGAASGRGLPSAAEARAARQGRLIVVVRKRPMNRREVQNSQQDVILARVNTVVVREPKLKVDLTRYVEEHNFLFDHAFDETTSNDQLYCGSVRPIIEAVFNKAKCTCFAYGQTGSGKTFTMMGPPKAQQQQGDKTPGIFLLAAQDIFRAQQNKEYNHLGVYIAFYEIYCGKLFDLLNNRQILHARENAKSNVVIVGLQEHLVENVGELMEVLEYGLGSRTTGVTGANVDSSRSHAILQICLKDVRGKEDPLMGPSGPTGGDGKQVHGKISFIDLAGSERGADREEADRQTRMDGAEINKSLLALKECIRALDQQQDHTPFRGSKLTQVLKDSFVGPNCRTVMIANVSPCSGAVEHSLNTLRYAYRVKELRRNTGLGSGAGAAELGGPLVDPTMNQGELPIEEESSDGGGDPEAEDSAGEDSAVQQQLRVAHLAQSAAQTLASPRARPERQPEPSPQSDRWADRVPQPEEVAVAPRYAAPMPGGAPMAAPSPEEMLATSGGAASQQHDMAPEVALEPVRCSQAELDELARQHDRLIGTILAEEEELITAHRQHIDNMVELIKEEMVHLNNVDRPGSDVDAYVSGLDRILRLKAGYITDIRSRVDVFKDHLSQEDSLSRKFQSLASSSS